MPENNEMNTVVETATEAATEAVQTVPEVTNPTFANQHPYTTAFLTSAGITGAAVAGAYVTWKVCEWAEGIPERWRNWRANVKAKKAAKANKPIEVVAEQEENA